MKQQKERIIIDNRNLFKHEEEYYMVIVIKQYQLKNILIKLDHTYNISQMI